MKDAIEYLEQRRPSAQFGMRIDNGAKGLFAYRWTSSEFSSLEEFCEFCTRFAHLFPLLLGEFDPRELDVFLIEDNLSLKSSVELMHGDVRTLIDQRIGESVIPWLKRNQFVMIDNASDGEALFLRAMGKRGFFAALVEEDYNDSLMDGDISSSKKLPLKKGAAAPCGELPFNDPDFIARTVNDCGTDEVSELDPFQLALNRIHQRVADRIGEPTIVHYSAYELDAQGIPIDNLDEIAILDYAVVLAEAEPDQFPGSVAFESEWMDEPTWLDLCAVAHNQMKHTRDFHHIFLEGVNKLRGASMHTPQASLFELLLGS